MANYNPRLAKINRSYTVPEIAALYEIHKNTVSNWLKQGLEDCGAGRPRLILGSALRRFLEDKRQKNKRPCKPGQIYCMGCRTPADPYKNEAILEITEYGRASIIGQCPMCFNKINRYVSLGKQSDWNGELVLTQTKA